MLRPTVAEVDLSAIRDNVRAIRTRVGPKVKIIPAVKANGYGHGAVPVSRACVEAGAEILGVACIDEAVELRDAFITAPILILGCSEHSSAEAIVEYDVVSTCCDMGFAKVLSDAAIRLGRKASVHVKVDTGMGRIGVQPEDAIEFARRIVEMPGLSVDGFFTHFPSADEADRTFTSGQIATFKKVVGGIHGVSGLSRATITHASNSAGVLAYPEADFDAVRPGITVYGLYPSSNVPRTVPVREALTLKTRVVFLKEAPAGTVVSYGRTYEIKRKSILATLPVGYGDGYPRMLSNCGEVAMRGQRAPIVGRVCMDQTVVDVTEIPGVEVGDDVVLYGGGYDYLAVDRLAEKIGTVSWEVFCAISPRVPRVYVNHS